MGTSLRSFAERIRGVWPLAVTALMTVVLSTGCATAGAAAHGWPGPGLPLDVDEEVLEEGAAAEATRAVAEVWAVASSVRQVGTRLSFIFWAEHGALTLTDFTAREQRGSLGEAVDEESTRRALDTLLRGAARQRTGAVELTLEREEASWRVGYSRIHHPRPPEAKTLPVRRTGLPAEILRTATEGLGRVMKGIQVPGGGAATVELAVHLEDWRVEAWELQRFEVSRRGARGGAHQPGAEVMGVTLPLVLPFTQGVGERTITLRLRLTQPKGARHVSGWVEEARVVRLGPPPSLNAEFALEYRAMHEDILRRWREDTKQGAAWVASRGAQELALWYVGGIIGKGVTWLGVKTLPTVMRALSRGGEAAAGWLRTTLRRLPGAKREVFERLWMKAHLEGQRALSRDEREMLRGLMEGMEQLVKTPLDKETKDLLRAEARRRYMVHFPHLAQALKEKGGALPIHHRRPLEYAQLFPDEDINAVDNLIMLTTEVHGRINGIWNKFRRARPQATASDVERVAQAIDTQFKHWYHQPTALPTAPHSLKQAEDATLTQLRQIFPDLP